MRITEINIGNEYIKNGLKPITMSKLNQCVIIAGKNGSGKSRLLSQITETLKLKPSKNKVEKALLQIKDYENKNKKVFEGVIRMYKKEINWNIIKTNDYYDNYPTVSFVPQNVDIKDCSNAGRKTLNDSAKKALDIGIEKLEDSSFAYIQVLQDRWFYATHPKSTISSEEKDKIIKEYEDLKLIIRTLLSCEIDRDLDNQATIFGFQLAQSNLSNGQKVILQYCIALHAQEASLDDHLLIMDEPENHLHPSILFELIEKIKKFNQKGQIWIATHSIPLLSYFDPQDIWYMEEGLISKYGKVSENVLGSLLGSEEQIEKLNDFINLPAIQAVNRFAYEALFPPPVADTDSTDPQTRQVHTAITNYIRPEGKIKILDYGAGKGRILNCTEESKDTFLEQVEYYAFEKSPINREDCIYSINQLYTNPEERYFQNEKDLKSKHDEHSFDIVIMCNVLHEIDPLNWFGLFGSNGFITKLLKETGILLLVEDHQLPHGEKAYQNGFIVLDTPEIKKLFNISSEDEDFGYDDFRGDGRLKAHRIPQPYLEKITDVTRKEALEELADNAKREIIKLRESESKSYRNGRLTGFWIHQLCNAILASSKL